MKPDIAAQKDALRRHIKALLQEISAEELSRQTKLIIERVDSMLEWSRAKVILGFSPGKTEPDISSLLRAAISTGKIICLPQFDPLQATYCAARVNDLDADTVVGKYGLLEPKRNCEVTPFDKIDAVLVPGIAFDRMGKRLGRGGGWFDRMLPEIHGLKIGVTFGVQYVDAVPSEQHDAKMDCLATSEELIRWK